MPGTVKTFWELKDVVWMMKQRQAEYEPGSEEWEAVDLQIRLREDRLAKWVFEDDS